MPNHWSKWAKWTFTADGGLTHFSLTYSDKGSYEIKKDELTYIYKVEGDKEWTTKKTVEILTLTVNELVWKASYSDDEYDYQIYSLEKE